MLSFFKKDIFGNPHFIKKWVIRIVGIVSYRMPAYDSKMSNEDLWHVVSYLRALQYSQLGKLEEIEIGRDELQKVIEAK